MPLMDLEEDVLDSRSAGAASSYREVTLRCAGAHRSGAARRRPPHGRLGARLALPPRRLPRSARVARRGGRRTAPRAPRGAGGPRPRPRRPTGSVRPRSGRGPAPSPRREARSDPLRGSIPAASVQPSGQTARPRRWVSMGWPRAPLLRLRMPEEGSSGDSGSVSGFPGWLRTWRSGVRIPPGAPAFLGVPITSGVVSSGAPSPAQDVEIVWSFTFGQEFPLVLSARLAARTSYAANEETGSFLGDSTEAILGLLGAASVTGLAGCSAAGCGHHEQVRLRLRESGARAGRDGGCPARLPGRRRLAARRAAVIRLRRRAASETPPHGSNRAKRPHRLAAVL